MKERFHVRRVDRQRVLPWPSCKRRLHLSIPAVFCIAGRAHCGYPADEWPWVRRGAVLMCGRGPVRIPFGGGARHNARTAQALADAMEVQAQLGLERERLAAEQEAARVRVEASRTQLAAAEQRASLARESRGFFDKSFRLGETDLPTRLRIEAEAAEAERQVALVRIELAAAISTKRQTLGLLPQ